MKFKLIVNEYEEEKVMPKIIGDYVTKIKKDKGEIKIVRESFDDTPGNLIDLFEEKYSISKDEISNINLPEWCNKLLTEKSSNEHSSIAKIMKLSFVKLVRFIDVKKIVWDDNSITTYEDILELGYGKDEFNKLKDLFSD